MPASATILTLPHTLSSGVRKEVERIDAWVKDVPGYVSSLGSLDSFLEHDRWLGLFSDLEVLIPSSPKLRILDVGVGVGRSSFWLARAGHDVRVLEPSCNQCEIIAELSRRFDLPVQIIQAPAEAMGALERASYDLVLFNAAFHHCDDPGAALAGCYDILKPGGRVLLVNEPVLKPYRSKAWFDRQLEEHPEAMGHYGGNEHTYYAWQYQNMLRRAGFRSHAGPTLKLQNLRSKLRYLTSVEQNGRFLFDGNKLAVHAILNAGASLAIRNAFLSRLLVGCSLLQATFVGTKS